MQSNLEVSRAKCEMLERKYRDTEEIKARDQR